MERKFFTEELKKAFEDYEEEAREGTASMAFDLEFEEGELNLKSFKHVNITGKQMVLVVAAIIQNLGIPKKIYPLIFSVLSGDVMEKREVVQQKEKEDETV